MISARGWSRGLLQAQEREQTRAGRELHDDVGQQLVVLSLGLAELNHSTVDAPQDVRDLIGTLVAQASELSATVLRLAHRLHPPTLQYMGLSSAIPSLCAQVSASHPIQIECVLEGVPADLPHDVALNLFRITQEAIANTIKHSGADGCAVVFRGNDVELCVDITDNGRGFDPNSAESNTGLGLISMKERGELINASVIVDSEPGRGTSVRVRAPLA